MQMQLRSTDLKFIIFGIVFCPLCWWKKKEVNKRKTFLSILYLHQYMMFKTHKEIRGVNASIFDWASCGIRYYEGLKKGVKAANGTYCLCALTDELIQHCSSIFQHKKKNTMQQRDFCSFFSCPSSGCWTLYFALRVEVFHHLPQSSPGPVKLHRPFLSLAEAALSLVASFVSSQTAALAHSLRRSRRYMIYVNY